MLMMKTVEEGHFSGFKFDTEEERLIHLQYVDDTLIIGEKKW